MTVCNETLLIVEKIQVSVPRCYFAQSKTTLSLLVTSPTSELNATGEPFDNEHKGALAGKDAHAGAHKGKAHKRDTCMSKTNIHILF